MKRQHLRKLLCFLPILLLSSGCGTIKLTSLEQDLLQEVLTNTKYATEHQTALRILEVDPAHADEFDVLTSGLTTLQGWIPPVLQQYPDAIPQRVKLKKAEKDQLIKTAYPFSQKIVQSAEQLTAAIAAARLAQIASNLEIIWSIDNATIVSYRRSPSYVIAHNGFLQARKRYPTVEIPATMQAQAQFLTLNEQTTELTATPLDATIPDVIAAAEAMTHSAKICEKILFHYLTRTGEISVSLNAASAPQTPTPALTPPPSDNFGDRILAALDETFGITGQLAPSAEQTAVVHFRRGGYALSHLSEDEKTALQKFVAQFVAAISAGDRLVITIRTVGYTDEVRLQENHPFVQNLIAALEDAREEVPRTEPARRKALNASFARLRALVINEYLKQLLKAEFGTTRQMQLISEIVGQGEVLPTGLTAPYHDEDRRICEVTLSVQ